MNHALRWTLVLPCLALAACGVAPTTSDAGADAPVRMNSEASTDAIVSNSDVIAEQSVPPDERDAAVLPDEPPLDVAVDEFVPPPDVIVVMDAAPEASNDAGADAMPDTPPDVPMPSNGTVLYPADRSISPMTESLAANLRMIAARGPRTTANVFAKIGDSNTVNTNFMSCFAGANVDLAGRTELQPTIDFYRGGNAGGTTPYQRVSLAATIGWSASSALRGSPNFVEQEITAINPRVALVMFGTNDVEVMNPFWFGDNLFTIIDQLLRSGVVPMLTSVPPRDDSAASDAWVPRYNNVVRGIAQGRGIPFLDLERELRPIAGHGLASDGVHLNVYVSGGARGCVFTTQALRYGNNVRNLLTMQGLHRTRLALNGGAAPDATAPTLTGNGSSAAPFVIPSLPFTHVANTATGGTRSLARYAGCMATQDESGPEFLYRFDVRTRVRVRAMALARTGADIDLHVLRGMPTEASCVQRNDRLLVLDLDPGTWYFSLDTFVSGGTARGGEYLFVLMQE